jgi:hypothetical protein
VGAMSLPAKAVAVRSSRSSAMGRPITASPRSGPPLATRSQALTAALGSHAPTLIEVPTRAEGF